MKRQTINAIILKKIFFLCFSVVFTNFIWSQITVNAPSSVEVGLNNQFSFTFLPKSGEYPSGSSSYKLTSWFINDGSSNMNNSGFGSYSNNSQSLNTYSIGQSQSLNFPIKWEDNSNSLTSNISIVANVSYYAVDANGNTYLAGSRIHPLTYTVNIYRISTPTLTSTAILSCCTNNVQISASNFGTANVFNWSISNGTIVSGLGTSSISVTPLGDTSSVFANCTVSRSTGSPTYTKFKSNTFARTARTIVITTSNSAYICAGVSKIFQIDDQCGMNGATWSATNSTVSAETVVNGKRQVTVTPNANLTTGSQITVNATASYSGGCTATNSSIVYVGSPRTTLPGATCYTTNAPCSVIAAASNNYLNFTLLSALLGNYVPLYGDWEWQKISGNFYFLNNINGQYNATSRNSPQADMYLTGANPTDNPLKFKTRVKSECGWGDWTEYVWNDGTTTVVTPPPPPAKYFVVAPNPTGGYSANILLLNPSILPPTTSPITANLYTIFGQLLSSTQLYNNSGMVYLYSFPYNTMYISIAFGTHRETHTVVKY